MCELLGMSASLPTDIRFSFTGLIQRAGEKDPNKDGWGIAFYEGQDCRLFKDHLPSSNSEVAKFIRHYPIKSKCVISHVRRANSGGVSLVNTHPFIRHFWGTIWCYAHNGQLKGVKKWPLKHFEPIGTTDSEHAFCWIMDQIKEKFKKRPKDHKKLWTFIEGLCQELSKHGVFNMLLSDSEYLYAFCTTRLVWINRRSPFGRAKLVDEELEMDFDKHNLANDIITIVATRPLTENEDWFKFNKKEFLVFKDGQLQNKEA